MARSSGLGKGLSSIIPSSDVPDPGDEPAGAHLSDIPVDAVTPNPNQPRVHFDEESLVELTTSIGQMGVLQPILVRRIADGYELIAGERRWRAAQRAGLSVIPAVVRVADDATSVEQALVENLHRQDLTALEEAAAYQQLADEFGLTHDQISNRVGKSRSAITNSLRLLGLPPAVQHLLADGQLSAGHARALLGTPDRSEQERLARVAAAEGWTVRMVEDAVRIEPTVDPDDTPAEPAGPADAVIDGAGIAGSTKLRPPGLLELETLLAEHLDTRVSVQMTAKRGRVTIDFADLEDLERIYRAMTG